MKRNNVVWHYGTVTRERREKLQGHKGAVVWFTGLSGSGKSTLAHIAEERLHQMGCRTYVFDGDNVRHGLCADLGFSLQDRSENIRRIGEMTKLFLDAGIVALNAFISPFMRDREAVQKLVGPDNFIEIYCRCPWKLASRGMLRVYTSVPEPEKSRSSLYFTPYEPPLHPDLLDTDEIAPEEGVER